MKKILFSTILSAVLFWSGAALADNCQAHNVIGWIWSENIGWISLACQNTVAIGSGINFGLNVDTVSGNFSGYAWSENIGWINLAPAGPYPASPNYSACLDFSGNGQTCDDLPGTNKVGGWARAVSYGGGWDGWIRLRDTNYGVNYASQSGALSGYAWSDMVIGWINFSGNNYGATVTASLNQSPDQPITSETNWNRCSFQGSSLPTFSWTYSDPDGDPQAAYEIELDDNSGFGAPKFNHLVNLAATSYVLDLHDDDENPDDLPSSMQDYQLDWNATYFWRVRVKDNQGNWSQWSNSSQSKTDKHASPYVDFSWVPTEPTQNETVEFTDQTQPYGGASIVSRLWTVISGNGSFVDGTTNSSASPHIQFSTLNNTLRLEVTDSDNYICYADENVEVQLPLPQYKETTPVSLLKKFLGGFIAFLD